CDLGATIAGQGGRYCTEAEVAGREQAAYARGIDAARAQADQQMVELRADVGRLAEGVFEKVSHLEPAVLGELREALPALARELARRLLAGYEPPPAVLSRICEEALGELFPERENLEIVVS